MTVQVDRRSGRSWRTWFVQCLMRPMSTEFIVMGGQKFEGIKDVVGSPKLTPPKLKGVTVKERVVEGLNVYTISKDSKISKTKHIYYFPGGAYKAQCAPLHWPFCAQLATNIPDCLVSIVSYPLSPLNSAPGTFKNNQKVCQTLIAESRKRGEKAIFAGDSAGGNLILAMTLDSLAENPKAEIPDALFLMSPCVDFTMSNPDIVKVEKNDPVLSIQWCKDCGDTWSRDWSLDDPRLSPLFFDYSVLKQRGIPVHGVLGKYDILYPDGELFLKKLDGAKGKFLVWDQQMHDFPLMSVLGLPEATAAVRWTVDVLKEV